MSSAAPRPEGAGRLCTMAEARVGRGRRCLIAQMGRARIVIADDHPVTRAGLRAVLADDPGVEIVGEATDGLQALAICRAARPDLVVMDICMPEMDGLQATRLLKESVPTTAVLILGMLEDGELLLEAIKAGAAGCLLKDASAADLRRAIREVLAGTRPFDRRLVRDVLPTASTVFSNREREVLGLLTNGCTNREIAQQLVISANTVKAHVEHILAKLGVSDRTQAAVQAVQRGYVIRVAQYQPPPA